MVAKLNSSSFLQTEGQVMAERPKNNCCFAAPNHPGNEKLRLSETVLQRVPIRSPHSLSQEKKKKNNSKQTSPDSSRFTPKHCALAKGAFQPTSGSSGKLVFQTSGNSDKEKSILATLAFAHEKEDIVLKHRH